MTKRIKTVLFVVAGCLFCAFFSCALFLLLVVASVVALRDVLPAETFALMTVLEFAMASAATFLAYRAIVLAVAGRVDFEAHFEPLVSEATRGRGKKGAT